jgi:hypothetical protein
LYPKPTIRVQQLSPNYKLCTEEEEEETTNCVTEGEKQKLSRDFILWRRKNMGLVVTGFKLSLRSSSKQAHFRHCKEG